jgi:CHAT domain-containing protein
LPGTAQEAQAILRLWPQASLLTARQVTEGAVKLLRAPRLLHFATHGFFLSDQPQELLDSTRGVVLKSTLPEPGPAPSPAVRAENPLLRSGLVLAGASLRQPGGEDGVLAALEAAGLDFRGTELVVLSACAAPLYSPGRRARS